MRTLFILLSSLSFLSSCTVLGGLAGVSDVQGAVDLKTGQAGRKSFSLLQANLSQVGELCQKDVENPKLCLSDLEKRIRVRLAGIKPDVVAFQGVMSTAACQKVSASPFWHTCHASHQGNQPNQIRRLLGPHYTLVCDPKDGSQCIGVSRAIGQVLTNESDQLCGIGNLCGSAELHHSKSLFSEYSAAYTGSDLETGYGIMDLSLQVLGQPLRLINGHPQAGQDVSHKTARKKQLSDMFESIEGYSIPVIVAGSFDFDPYRSKTASSTKVWSQFVTGDLKALSGAEGDTMPDFTSAYKWPVKNATVDHVLGKSIEGRCHTLSGDERLDGGEGLGHLGVLCNLKLPS